MVKSVTSSIKAEGVDEETTSDGRTGRIEAWYLRPDPQPRQHPVHVGQEGGGQLRHGQGGEASSVVAGQIQHSRE